jgi:uncharacterized peroxidase-related enzyme
MVDRFAHDWRAAGLDLATVALLEHAEKLTLRPSDCAADDVTALRAAGWDDRAIHDAVQVCAYFNYINRIAEGLGVDHEDWLDDVGRPVPGMQPGT